MNSATAIVDPDAFYERLLDAQRGLDEEAQRQFTMRLVLLLANQVGDDAVLAQCVEAAARSLHDR